MTLPGRGLGEQKFDCGCAENSSLVHGLIQQTLIKGQIQGDKGAEGAEK